MLLLSIIACKRSQTGGRNRKKCTLRLPNGFVCSRMQYEIALLKKSMVDFKSAK